jgi:phage shock protein A
MNAKSHAKVDRMEDPTEMVNQLLREKASAVSAAKLALARAKVWQQQLSDQQQSLGREVLRYQELATQALRDDREEIARQALQKKRDVEDRQAEIERQAQQAEKLRLRQEKQLEKQQVALRDLKNRREAIIQKQLFTDAAANMLPNDACTEEPASIVLERLESKISYRESEVEAFLQSERPNEEQQLDQYQRDREIDLEMAQLKQSLA